MCWLALGGADAGHGGQMCGKGGWGAVETVCAAVWVGGVGTQKEDKDVHLSGKFEAMQDIFDATACR